MSKFLVCVFPDLKAAQSGADALQQLQGRGDIVIYARAMVTKDENGSVQQIEDPGDEAALSATGALVGGLIGAFGGVAGVAAGLAAGSLGGLFVDLTSASVDYAFLDEVSEKLSPGTCAIIMEVTENWGLAVNQSIEQLGGTVIRRWRIDVADKQIEREIEMTKRDVAAFQDDLSSCEEDARDDLQYHLEAAEQKLQSLRDQAKEKVASMQAEAKARLRILEQQIAHAKDEARRRLEKYRDELKSDYETRTTQLADSAQTTVEALA